MRILLLTHYYPPEVNAPAQRAAHHANEWVKAGHQVTVVTAAPSHPYGIVYDGYKNKYFESVVDGVRVVRMRTYLGANSGFAKRTINYLSYFSSTLFNIRKFREHDIVISSSPQFFCGLSGIIVKKFHKIPWILEIRDIWPDSILAVGAANVGFTTKMVSLLARWAYKASDAVVSVSPGFNEHFDTYGVDKNKLHTIPNGIYPDSLQRNNIDLIPREMKQFDGRFIAAFIGTLGMAHGLTTILTAAKLLKKNKNIGILLVGSGADYESLVKTKSDLQLDNVVILGQQSRERVAEIWNSVSASIVHLKKNDTFKTVIPTKLLEGMAMKRPVILGVEGTAKSILESANAGISIEPENAEELAKAVTTLASDSKLGEFYAENGYRYVIEHFNRAKMANQYIVIMQSLVGCSFIDKVENESSKQTN